MDIAISVIIPVFNTPKDKLLRCVNSVLIQSFQNFEIIIVDDGSDVDYAEYLDSIAHMDKRIRVIHKENEGSAVARNTGIFNARYDYLTFIDSDDFITSYAMLEAEKLIKIYNPDMVLGLVQHFGENDTSASSYLMNNKAKVLEINTEHTISEYVSHMLGYTSKEFVFGVGYIGDGPVARVCKTDIVQKAPFSSEAFWSEDTIWNLKLAHECKNIIITGNIWYAYLIHNDSTTRKYRKNCLYEFQYRIHQEMELVNSLWPECMEGVYVRIWREIAILCRTYLFHEENKLTNQKKLEVFREALHSKDYVDMLRHIKFKNEQNFLKKIVKQMIRVFSLYGPNILSYYFWEYDTKRNNKR